jgi:hypothetical protein
VNEFINELPKNYQKNEGLNLARAENPNYGTEKVGVANSNSIVTSNNFKEEPKEILHNSVYVKRSTLE